MLQEVSCLVMNDYLRLLFALKLLGNNSEKKNLLGGINEAVSLAYIFEHEVRRKLEFQRTDYNLYVFARCTSVGLLAVCQLDWVET